MGRGKANGADEQAVRTAFDKYAHQGAFRMCDLRSLLGDLNLANDDRTLVQVQGNIRVMQGHSSSIDFTSFFKWYKAETTAGIFEHNNELLVRKQIGKSRLPTRNLKEGSFIYGEKNPRDKHGAGEVVLNWVTGERSKSKQAGVSLIKVNKAAVKNKLVSPKAVSKFLRNNKDDKRLQRPQILGSKKARGDNNRVSNDIDYAPDKRQTGANIKDILFPPQSGTVDEDPDYVEKSGQRKKGKLPFPRQTKSSLLCRDITSKRKEKAEEKASRKPWKMKKFAQVKSRWTLHDAVEAAMEEKEEEEKTAEQSEETKEEEAKVPEVEA